MSSTVADVMTSEAVSVSPDTPFKDCVEMLGVHQVGALPVTDKNGRLLGILTESDLLRKEEVKGGRPPFPRASATVASEAMTRAPVTVAPSTGIGEAARLMNQASVRHLLVTGSDGRLLGIVARADLLKVFLRSDESIRHEIDGELFPATFGIPHGTLDVEVRNGVVHLGGEVDKGQDKLLSAFTQRVEGVVAVVSRLRQRVEVGGKP
ncbi:MAG TPA: CBS domain-containing protein [Candidatus Dormibacteraeota bacterium]|nr:CBS domain-containing protein [Candidatus Dormibacteraeota bacterium]